ncbi:MAG: F-type H+-transporting ATPase subunit epsilon, partial [Candidatus Omnitrophota bacterium]
MKNFSLSIITPDGIVYKGDITSLVVPGSEGSFGIWANHTPLIASLKPGVVISKDESKEIYITTSSGALEVSENNRVIILVDSAV